MTARLTRKIEFIPDGPVSREILRLDENDGLLNQAIDSLIARGFKSYQTVWKGASSDPAILDGTLDAYYRVHDGLCSVHLSLIAGASTTFGTGAWTFSLPVQSWDKPDGLTRVGAMGSLYVQDTSAPQWYVGVCRVRPMTNILDVYAEGGKVTSSVPFAWDEDDELQLSIQYPVFGA